MSHKIVLFYIPFPDRKSAFSFCKMAIDQKLAACANIYSGDSMFVWEKKLQSGKEFTAILKTTKENRKNLFRFARKNHPYDCPAILSVKVNANKQYKRWLKEELTPID